MSHVSMRRRALVASLSSLAMVAGLAAGAYAQDRPFDGTKLTYWGGLIYSDEANQMLIDEIAAWGDANGVDTEVILINQNETVQKVSAAIESGTMPDALDVALDLLLLMAAQGVLLNIDDIYERVGEEQGGWYEPIANATDTTAIAGGRTGLPFGANGNLILRRSDLLEAAGISEAPKTWAELVDHAEAATEGTVFGLGLALANGFDGNMQVSVLQSYGGRIADDDGKTVTLKSEETRAYLDWVKDAWDRGVFPPGVATWDGAGDNQSYLSGQAAFIANTGSVGIAAKAQDPELYDVTRYSALPAGPVLTVSPMTPQLRVIPASTENPEAAKALLEHLARPEFMDAYFSMAIYGPVLKGQAAFSSFTGDDPVLKGLLDLVENGTAPGWPDVYNAAYADAYANYLIPKMVQRVVIDGWDIDRAMDEAQSQAEAIYSKY